MATWIIGLIVLAFVLLAGRSVYKEFKGGTCSTCGGKCGNCSGCSHK